MFKWGWGQLGDYVGVTARHSFLTVKFRYGKGLDIKSRHIDSHFTYVKDLVVVMKKNL